MWKWNPFTEFETQSTQTARINVGNVHFCKLLIRSQLCESYVPYQYVSKTWHVT